MAELRIRVGASLDSSIDTVFPKLAAAAKRGRESVQKEMDAAGHSIGTGLKRGTATADKEFAKLASWAAKASAATAREAAKGAAAQERASAKATKAAEREAAAFERLQERKLASLTRELAQEQRLQEAAARKAARAAASAGSSGDVSRFGRRMGYWGLRNFSPITPTLSMGRRLAGDLARGAGVNFDAGSMMKSYVDRQKLAQDIANSGYQPGMAGPAGKLQNAGDISSEVNRVATATGTDPTKALEGLQKFVAITGDLSTGRAILGDMAKLARATGSNLETVVDAAGEVSAKIGDIPNKAEVVNTVMRQIAGAGKMGAVEMRDFAAQLGKISGLASRFKGDTATNIGEMGILMQLARQKGGSGSADQAATAVTGFVATMRTPSKLKALESLIGHSAYVDKNHTQLASPEAIILEAITHAKGSQVALGKVFSKRSMDVVGGAANIYNEAGGGAKGVDAVKTYFADLRKSAMTAKDADEAFARSMATAEAKAQVFQNQLQSIADKVATKVIPAMEQMAPKIMQLADAFGSVVEWFASHSIGADILALLTASIAKTSMEQALRIGIERAFSGKNLAAAGGEAGSILGSGAAGKAVGGVAAFAAGWAVGKIIVDEIVAGNIQNQNKVVAGVLDSANANAHDQTQAALEADLAKAKANVETARNAGGGVGNAFMDALSTMMGHGEEVADKDKENARAVAMALDSMHAIEEHLAAIKAQGAATIGTNNGGGVSIPRNPVEADPTGRMPVSPHGWGPGAGGGM